MLHPFPKSRKPRISMCRDWPSFRLAPEPATFGSFLYTDMWTPPCSIHTPIQENQGFLCVGIGRASVWHPSQPHSGFSYTRICGPLRAPSIPQNKKNKEFDVSGLAQLPSGARASHIREFPIHGYVPPPLTSLTPLRGRTAGPPAGGPPRETSPPWPLPPPAVPQFGFWPAAVISW